MEDDDRPGRRIGRPVHAPGPRGPWERIRALVREHGIAVVYTTWPEWLPAMRCGPGLRLLLGTDWDRFVRIPEPSVRSRFAASRLIVKYAAAASLGTEPVLLELAYRPGGRPYLRGCDQLEVSLTHTEKVIAVGLNRRGRIGVDVELTGRALHPDLARRVCTPAESTTLGRLPADVREAELRRLWTLKEAYTKALGQGMRLGFTEFGFGPDDRDGLCTPMGSRGERGEWAFATFTVLGRCLLSVAGHDAGLDPDPDIHVGSMLDERFRAAVAEWTP
jgi:4'-phosphopantetheinyl transferase